MRIRHAAMASVLQSAGVRRVKILVVSDAWVPQVNGVVRTLQATQREAMRMGHDMRIIGPAAKGFFSFPLPFYPEIRLEFFAHNRLAKILRDFSPDAVHIATEGSLGWAARRICLREGRKFTTAYHTGFPDYLAKRLPSVLAPVVVHAAYAVLRRFHAPSSAVMVATTSVERELKAHHFCNLVLWTRGVDTALFKPYGKTLAAFENLPRPILLNVGRVSVEKNLCAFLDLKTTGSKVVIGDGPDLPLLRQRYPQAHFLGAMEGETLTRHYAAADLFVFPSTTDTFGLVLLEACAAGLRVATYPAAGPADIFVDESCKAFAVLNADLQRAVDLALSLPNNPETPRQFAARFSWQASATQFVTHVQALFGKGTPTT